MFNLNSVPGWDLLVRRYLPYLFLGLSLLYERPGDRELFPRGLDCERNIIIMGCTHASFIPLSPCIKVFQVLK